MLCKQTVDGETEHNMKKTKMATARKPESLVWTDNDVELLLWLTLNYKVSKLQERWTQACSPPMLLLLLLLWDFAGFKGRSPRGGAMASSIRNVCGFGVCTRTQRLRFQIFPPWDPVSKRCVFRIRVDDETMQNMWVYTKECFHVGGPEVDVRFNIFGKVI